MEKTLNDQKVLLLSQIRKKHAVSDFYILVLSRHYFVVFYIFCFIFEKQIIQNEWKKMHVFRMCRADKDASNASNQFVPNCYISPSPRRDIVSVQHCPVSTWDRGATVVKVPVVQHVKFKTIKKIKTKLTKNNLCPIFWSSLKLNSEATVMQHLHGEKAVTHYCCATLHQVYMHILAALEPAVCPTRCNAFWDLPGRRRVSLCRNVTFLTYKSSPRRTRPLSQALKTVTLAQIMSC